ncbi:hypothetical protein NXS98_11020 [Fontisphaera persica]|nr:hypothetical protein [Fontisphaera persica]WCJ58257.1 hypothetical protein NXS98_11020 [Fontisphaera persica]
MEKLLAQAAAGRHKLLLSAVNWGEIYYNTMRKISQEAAEQMAREIAALPIEIVGVGDDLALVRQAAVFKAAHKMAYANGFAAALAKTKRPPSSPATPDSKLWKARLKLTG